MKLLCSDCKKGFHLRSWNSNSLQLLALEKFSRDVTSIEHDGKLDKALRNKYSCNVISEYNLDSTSDTRRPILPQFSKVFDFLGLCLPVTVKGKVLMREFWSFTDKTWDDTVLSESANMIEALF